MLLRLHYCNLRIVHYIFTLIRPQNCINLLRGFKQSVSCAVSLANSFHSYSASFLHSLSCQFLTQFQFSSFLHNFSCLFLAQFQVSLSRSVSVFQFLAQFQFSSFLRSFSCQFLAQFQLPVFSVMIPRRQQ